MAADSFLKLHLIDCLWNFSLGSKVRVHRLSRISSVDWSPSWPRPALSRRRRVNEGAVRWCEWTSCTSVSAADNAHYTKTEEEWSFKCRINSLMGKLATCSCHTAVWEKGLTGGGAQNTPAQLVMAIVCLFFYETFKIWCTKYRCNTDL